MKTLFFILLLLGLSELLYSQSFEDMSTPWEAEDIYLKEDIDSIISTSTLNVMMKPVDIVINLYQMDITGNSIQRCPFKISCSNFAKIAIKKHGVLGILIFLDRYFFRENISAYINYNFVLTKGVLKLDDSIYLY